MTNEHTTTIPDALLRHALVELAEGPEAGGLTTAVIERVAATPQRRGLVWRVPQRRPVTLVWIAALVTAALLAGVLTAGALLRKPAPMRIRPANLVVQTWNGLRDPDARVIQTVFSPTGFAGRPLEGVGTNAVSLRWSPDGARLLYFERAHPADLKGFTLTGLFVAQPDGTVPAEIRPPRGLSQYASNGWWAGALWAPAGGRFALPWSTYSCSGSPDCMPPGGIDLFDERGNLLDTITPPNDTFAVTWSPDGNAIGWTPSACAASVCATERFDWRLVERGSPVTSIPLPGAGQVVWAGDRLFVTIVSRDGQIQRVFSIKAHGGDAREVDWPEITSFSRALWSPDGKAIAATDGQGRLQIRDVAAGTTARATIPGGVDLASWSPDGSSLVLDGASTSNGGDYRLYRIQADGTGLTPLGDAEDFGWMPLATP